MVVVPFAAWKIKPPSLAVAFASYVVNVVRVLVVLPAIVIDALCVAFDDRKRIAALKPVSTVLPDMVIRSVELGDVFLNPILLFTASRNNRSVSNVALPETTSVLDSVVAPVTASVFDRVALPVTDIVFENVAAPVTPNVLASVTAPFTTAVPNTRKEPTLASPNELLILPFVDRTIRWGVRVCPTSLTLAVRFIAVPPYDEDSLNAVEFASTT